MPSLKFLLSFAVVAVVLSPIVATPLPEVEASHFSRRVGLNDDALAERDLSAPAALLVRRESREEAAARVLLAKNRAARKVRRALSPPTCFPQGVTTVPDHGTFRTTDKGCKLVCSHSEGYKPSGDGRSCKLASTTPSPSCGDPVVIDGQTVGTHRTTATGACKLVCYKSTGYRVSGGTCVQAYDISSDPDHCGPTGQVCLAGYPSGEPACNAGVCTITCSSGRPTPVPGTPYFTCA